MRKVSLLIVATLLNVACVTEKSAVDGRPMNFDKQEAAKTRLLLGLGYLHNKDFNQAKANLEKAKQFAPLRADVHYGFAYYYQQVGDVPAAMQSYQTAINIEPNNPDTLNNFGAFLCQQKQYLEAENLFLRALAIPSYTNAAQTYENLALCAMDVELYEKAIKYFEMAYRHGQQTPELSYQLAGLLFATDEANIALTYLQPLIGSEAQNENVLLLAALISFQLDNKEQSEYFKKMLLTDYPDSFPALMLSAGSVNAFKFVKIQKQINQMNLVDIASFSKGDENAAKSHKVMKIDEISSPVELASTESNQNQTGEIIERTQWLSIPKQKVKIPSIVVQNGENLFRISLKHNIQIRTLKKWNKLKKDQVNTGRKLYIRNPDIYYVVKQPQKLSTIAKVLDISFDDLKRWNKLNSDGFVAKGSKLIKVNLEKY